MLTKTLREYCKIPYDDEEEITGKQTKYYSFQTIDQFFLKVNTFNLFAKRFNCQVNFLANRTSESRKKSIAMACPGADWET